MKRVLFDISLFIFIFLLPWWTTFIWAIVGLFVFINFYEFLVASIMVYVLIAVPFDKMLNHSFFIYSGIIIFYLLVQYLRRHIILYKNEIPYKS